MILFKRISDLKNYLKQKRTAGSCIGFVPTMGALHEGHLTLIETSKTKGDLTVCSIFVNPTQFNDPSDFEKYPVTIEEDIPLLEQKGCDVLFLPSVNEMYPEGLASTSHYDLGSIENIWEGYYRPGHFQGVARVVDKFLTAVKPDDLFMGQKDYQQCMVIDRLIELKKFSIQLHVVPTIRSSEGLALSSRNARLNESAKKNALVLSRVLRSMIEKLPSVPFSTLIENGKKEILHHEFDKIDYLAVCDAKTLEPVAIYQAGSSYVVIVAAFINGVRLIDNMLNHS